MEVEILKQSANELEMKLDDLTLAEVLRAYLQKDSNVEFAAWKRDNPSKPVLLRVETKGKNVKKAFEDAVKLIGKESEGLIEVVKKC